MTWFRAWDGNLYNAGRDARIVREPVPGTEITEICLRLASDTCESEGYTLANVEVGEADAVMEGIAGKLSWDTNLVDMRAIVESVKAERTA